VAHSPNHPPKQERSPRRSSRPDRAPNARRTGQRTTNKVLALTTVALTLYLGVLWLGIAVIGDNPIRSAVMAALIVAIAATGYVFTSRPAAGDD